MIIVPGRTQPEPEPYWLVDDVHGSLIGPIDPGTISFKTPVGVRGQDLRNLNVTADLLLNAAAKSHEELQRTMAFLQRGGQKAYRTFMEHGLVPRQTPAYMGSRGGSIAYGWLGDGAAAVSPGVGLVIDDSKNGTTFVGYAGATAAASVTTGANNPGVGPGRGLGGANSGTNAGGGGGGGFGSAGAAGTQKTIALNGEGGPVNVFKGSPIWEALRSNTWDLATLLIGGGGGAGGSAAAGNGGGGSGGLWVGVAANVAYGSGTIA